jgi:outer membrane immunogenic protein
VRIAILAMGAAVAAAIPARAESPSNFAGAYIGLNAGAAWGTSNFATNPNCPPDPAGAVFCNAAPDPTAALGSPVAASGTGTLSPFGFTGGVQGGYNWQVGSFVLGGEADFGALALDRSASSSGAFPPSPFLGTAYSLTERMSTDWVATLRARAGVIVTPQLLLYATGGVAFTDFKFESSYADNAIDATFPGGTGVGNLSDVRTGWTVGGGGEWALTGNWSVKAEYLYLDFGSVTLPVAVSNTAAFTQTMQINADLSAQIVRVGINYRP